MRAAIYARKSTGQDVAREAKSVTRQIADAVAFAEARGWKVVEQYVDDGISGADWTRRDGLTRLLADVKRRPRPFDVLVTLDIDRVGRDGANTVPKLKLVYDEGVRLFFYQNAEEVHLKTPMDVFMLQARAFSAADYRHQVRQKTSRALRSKAEQGLVAGGRVLGYRNVEVLDAAGKRAGVRREIDPAEAEIVQRIFDLAASGKGLLRIVRALTEAGIKNPTGQDRAAASKRTTTWAATGVRAVLHRELYRGKVVYGRLARTDKGERINVRVVTDESSWLVRDEPSLRIVSDETWERAHARIAQTRASYVRRPGGRLMNKPESGLESKYLLSGFLVCATCGGRMYVTHRSLLRGKPRTLTYICSEHRARPEKCPVASGVKLADIDEQIISDLASVLSPELLAEVRERTLAGLTSGDAAARRRQAVVADIAQVEADLQALLKAVLNGNDSQTVRAAMKAKEAEKRDLAARLEHEDGLLVAARETASATEARLRDISATWTSLLTAVPATGRPALRALLDGHPIRVWSERDGSWGYQVEGLLASVLNGGWGATSHQFSCVRVSDEEARREARENTDEEGDPASLPPRACPPSWREWRGCGWMLRYGTRPGPRSATATSAAALAPPSRHQWRHRPKGRSPGRRSRRLRGAGAEHPEVAQVGTQGAERRSTPAPRPARRSSGAAGSSAP